MSKPQSLPQVIADIRRKGDTLYAHRRLHRNRFARHLVGWQVPATVFTGITTTSQNGLSLPAIGIDALSYAPLGLTATGAATVSYAISRFVEKRKIRAAEGRREKVSSLLGEHVEILRLPAEEKRGISTKRKKHLALRWYGLTYAGSETGSPGKRLESLLWATAGTDVDTFIFDADILGNIEDIHEFGTIVDSTKFTSTKKIEIVDLRTKKVMVSTRDQCKKIVERLKIEDSISILGKIIQQGKSASRIPLAVAGSNIQSGAGLRQLELAILGELEALEEAKLPAAIGYVEEKGDPVTRAPLKSTIAFRKGKKSVAQVYLDENNNPQAANSFSEPLLESVGYSSLPELVKDLVAYAKLQEAKQQGKKEKQNLDDEQKTLTEVKKKENEAAEALAEERANQARIALLLLVQQVKQQWDEKPATRTQAPSAQAITLSARLVDEPPRTIPRLRKTGKVAKNAEPTLEYHRRKQGRLKRAAIGVALGLGIAYVGPYLGGTLVPDREASIEQSYSDEYSKEREQERERKGGLIEIFPDIEKYAREHASPKEKTFLTTLDSLRKIRHEIDAQVVDSIQAPDIDSGIFQSVQDLFASQEPPPSFSPLNNSAASAYTTPEGQVGIGDVSPDNDYPVFHINSMDGSPLAGFWYTQINDILDLNMGPGTPPYKNLAIKFRSSEDSVDYEKFILPTAPPENVAPSYEITYPIKITPTDFGEAKQGYENVALPTRPGKKVVAVTIESSNPDQKVNSTFLTVNKSPTRGTYIASFPVDTVKNLENPTLRYWLAPSSAPEDTPRAAGPMLFSILGNNPEKLLSEVLPPSSREQIKQALGLPADANDAQILKELRNKDYSFTPISDLDLRPTESVIGLSSDDPHVDEKLTKMGKALAEMPLENCNTSGGTFQLATGGKYEGGDTNVAAGYNNRDEGVLTRLEAHTLAVNTAGEAIDPTAQKGQPQLPPPPSAETASPSQEPNPWLNDIVRFLEGAALAILWRKRKSLSALYENLRYSFLNKNGNHADAYHQVISALEYARYAPPENAWPTGFDYSKERSLPERLATQAVTPPLSYREGLEALKKAKVNTFSPRIQIALYQLTTRNVPRMWPAKVQAGWEKVYPPARKRARRASEKRAEANKKESPLSQPLPAIKSGVVNAAQKPTTL